MNSIESLLADAESLKESLSEAGWRISTGPTHLMGDLLNWYAWLPARPSEWPDCECNEKPPSLTVQPLVAALPNGAGYGRATVRLVGQAGGQWLELSSYSLTLDEVMQALPSAKKALGAAWTAAHAAMKD